MDIIERISKLKPEQLQQLEAKLIQQNFDIFRIPITPDYHNIKESSDKTFPLSFEQEPMWFAEQFHPNSFTYNIISAVKIEGPLNIQVFDASINEIVKRHEILRAVFSIENGNPVQSIIPYSQPSQYQLQIIDYKSFPQTEQEAKIELLRTDTRFQEFDMVNGPLFRAVLVELDSTRFIFFCVMHHIISDILSFKVFFEELAIIYTFLLPGQVGAQTVEPLPYQYIDYACWQKRWIIRSLMGTELRKKQERFWLDHFEGDVPTLNLPVDFPRPSVKNRDSERAIFILNEEETVNLKNIAVRGNTTLYTVLFSLLYVFLSKLSGQEDIVAGTPISSRKQPELNRLIGMFTRTLAIRNYPAGNKLFMEFLSEVNTRTYDAFGNQEYPYEELVGKILVERDLGRNPLFDVIFTFNFLDTAEIEMPGLKLESLRWRNRHSIFDLDLSIDGSPTELIFKLSYSTELFKEETIARFVTYYKNIMVEIGKDPSLKLSDIDFIPPGEKEQLLHEFNNTGKEFPREKNYAQLFEDTVHRSPDAIAAVYRDHSITYRELNDEALLLSYLLSINDIGPGSVVSIFMRRSIKTLAAIIGIYKRGACYLPIEIDYPNERIEFILGNSEAKVVFTESSYIDRIYKMKPSLPGLLETVSLTHERKYDIEGNERLCPLSMEKRNLHELAYIIYTSGTTGKPKGVMIHQLGMINHLYAKINDLSIQSEDRVAQTASACFDISVWQFLSALLTGGTTVMIDKETILDSPLFFKALERNRITVLESVPSLMISFLESEMQGDIKSVRSLPYLRWMLSTGEPLTVQLAYSWYKYYPGVQLMNAYGPTEASDDITHYIVPPVLSSSQSTVSIGKPLQNLQIYILDKYLSLCPVGIRGEICVAGVGVGKGYWKDRDKTNAVFVPNTFSSKIENSEDRILYKTGDIGYWRSDGNIECLGRIDSQVKIRGNRIELGEIENRLLNHEAVKEAVVVVRTSTSDKKTSIDNDRFLCAYIVSYREITVSEWKEFLSGTIPEYMIPLYFVRLEKMPLNTSGKIDRKSLPEPDYENMERNENLLAPSTGNELKLARIWSEILGIDIASIGLNSNFFEIGGHSLKAAMAISMIRKEFQVDIPLIEIFRMPTMGALASYLEPLTNPITPSNFAREGESNNTNE